MKKIITLLLLLIFCTEPACWATDIIIGADRQARYADGVETPLVKEDVKVEKMLEANKKEDVTQKLIIETKADLEKIIKPYTKKNLKFIDKAPKEIDYQNIVKEKNILSLKSNSNATKFELQDGDYALWTWSQRSTHYAGEFHKDGSLMGIVKIRKINSKTIIFYEYRSESIDAKTAPLKHIMITYNDNQHTRCFIYTTDKKLRCYQQDEVVYAIDLPGFPDLQKVDLTSTWTETKEKANEIGTIAGFIVELPIAIPFIILVAPLVLLFGDPGDPSGHPGLLNR